eukprot:TRINITY_DN1655_c0_g2_i1.p5 TRINITY_DN1655_c0_g2~~TRINITY_DN1655_c0_g2_i1.p5  ORF type:complete len:220 (+),score=38.16 TRINITY_DN1655_c0_g2_i1:2058-2717(+)
MQKPVLKKSSFYHTLKQHPIRKKTYFYSNNISPNLSPQLSSINPSNNQLLKQTAAGLCISLAAFGQLIFSSPSFALEIDTVSPSTITESARPLPEQSFDKGKIWLLLVGGAASLLALTIQIENFEFLFPAISSANKAMSSYRERVKNQEEEEKKVQQLQRIDKAVEAGLRQASAKKIVPQTSDLNQNGGMDKQEDLNEERIKQLEEEVNKRKKEQQEVS